MRSFVVFALLSIPSLAHAHVSLSSGPAQANKSQLISFGVGHGCTDTAGKHLDTVKIKVTIPTGVTGVRGIRSDFGNPTYTKTGTTVTHITWTKPASDLLEADDSYYEIKLRARVPDAPFTKLQWNIEQTCEDSSTGAQIVVLWDQPEGSTTGEPAAIQAIVPARTTGWNKFTMARAMTIQEVAAYLGDALIVWRGNAAYSSNQHTAAMIAATDGVVMLDGVAANDELWVRY
jgi:uncharacterized protein YcnI